MFESARLADSDVEASEPPKPPVNDEAIIERLAEAVGPPSYEQDGVALFCADCVEALSAIDDGSVQLTVTSPPYNIGKEFDVERELDVYLDWCAEWATQVARVTAGDGSFWLNLGYTTQSARSKALPLTYLLWNRVPMYLVQEIVWHYGAGVAARRSFSPRNEKFLWYVKNPNDYVFDLDSVRDPHVRYPNQKKNGKLKCNPAGKNPSDVWIIPKVTSGSQRSSPERTPHPSQFPIALIERIVRAASRTNDVVLDPFVGSGTTAVVAQSLGRRIIGFDRNASYLKVAAARLREQRIRGDQLSLRVGPQLN